jgi:hypothetical protein
MGVFRHLKSRSPLVRGVGRAEPDNAVVVAENAFTA